MGGFWQINQTPHLCLPDSAFIDEFSNAHISTDFNSHPLRYFFLKPINVKIQDANKTVLFGGVAETHPSSGRFCSMRSHIVLIMKHVVFISCCGGPEVSDLRPGLCVVGCRCRRLWWAACRSLCHRHATPAGCTAWCCPSCGNTWPEEWRKEGRNDFFI